MKTFLAILMLASLPASATTYLRGGETRYITNDYVTCGGGNPGGGGAPQQSWTCACFRRNDNVGTVSFYAGDKQDAVYRGQSECRRVYRDYSLTTASFGCFTNYR